MKSNNSFSVLFVLDFDKFKHIFRESYDTDNPIIICPIVVKLMNFSNIPSTIRITDQSTKDFGLLN